MRRALSKRGAQARERALLTIIWQQHDLFQHARARQAERAGLVRRKQRAAQRASLTADHQDTGIQRDQLKAARDTVIGRWAKTFTKGTAWQRAGRMEKHPTPPDPLVSHLSDAEREAVLADLQTLRQKQLQRIIRQNSDIR